MSKTIRKVLTPRGFEYIEVASPKIDSVKLVDAFKEEVKESFTAAVDVELSMPNIAEMDLTELKELATSMDFKIGNRGLVKAREFMLSKFEISEEEEL